MSELKERDARELILNNHYWPNEESMKVYLKAEADKVIAEKDEKIDELEERIDELQKATDSAWSKVNAMYDELRHHKYKRCLDKAEICCEKKENCYNQALRKYSKDEADYLVRKSEFWQDWEFRWIKLAEKFKEVK